MEKLGVLGGLGPAATARLLARVVHYTQADCDQQHLNAVVFNQPSIPDRTAYLLGHLGAQSFVEPMRDLACRLESLGCTVLATPCNTAHARLNDIAAGLTSAHFVHMPHEAAKFAHALGCMRVGILATDGSLEVGIHQQALAEQGIEAVTPEFEAQKMIMSVIYDEIKAGKPVSIEGVMQVLASLQNAGCDAVILGCTELSLLDLQRRLCDMVIIDALDVLAWRCVQECGASASDLIGEYEP